MSNSVEGQKGRMKMAKKGYKAFVYDIDGTNLGEVGTLKGSTIFELVENIPFHKLVIYLSLIHI